MATIKVACPKCGQKVSGDESFHGTVVECPVCSADIRFPGQGASGRGSGAAPAIVPVPPETAPPDEVPPASASLAESSAGPAGELAAGAPPARNLDDAETEPALPPSPLWGAISIVSAVLSVVICLVGGVLFAPVAIIAGHTALAKARHSPVQPAPGHTLGAIGLMIGYVSLVLTIVVLLLLVLFGDGLKELLSRSAE